MVDHATAQVGVLEITQVRSLIGAKANQRATVRSLGLKRIRHTVTQPDRPEIRGMVAKVAHLVVVRYSDAEEVLDLEAGQEPKGPGNPVAGPSVADDEVTALREAEADALSVPGSAPGATMAQQPAGLTSRDDPNPPKASGSALAAEADAEDEDEDEPATVSEDAIADPRGDLGHAEEDDQS